MGKIVAVCISEKKGTSKTNLKKGVLKENHGLLGDAHAGKWHRQVSLLAKESLEKIERKGKKIGCGGFGENLTTSGIELTSLVVGTRLKVGQKALLKVTQIGKTCQKPCQIYKDKGLCILPSQGIFARVLKGETIKSGDKIEIENNPNLTLGGILTISDSCAEGKREDKSGQFLKENLQSISGQAIRYKIVPDDSNLISATLKNWADKGSLDFIFTTGGTGFSPRDVTPEATKKVLDKETPGIAEMLRVEGAKKTKRAYLSRGLAGIRKKTLIINLPGSLKAVGESLEIISPVLPHALEIIKGRITTHDS